VEVPPGPPVISTVVAEIYGMPGKSYEDLVQAAAGIEAVMHREPFVVDIDSTVEFPQHRLDFVIDKEKAALHGITPDAVVQTLRMSTVCGPATVHSPGERQCLPIRLTYPREKRAGRTALSQIPVKTADGKMVPLAEIGVFVETREDQPIYHKNLERVVYVSAEMAGRAPAEAILDMQKTLRRRPSTLRESGWNGPGKGSGRSPWTFSGTSAWPMLER
jgi:multidrug efflux pump subunit AcrB